MEIKRIDTYRDGRFSQRVLCQHGCFLVDGMPCEVEIISDSEAVIRGACPEAYEQIIENFRFYTPHITGFYDEKGVVVREYPPVQLLKVNLNQIQPSQFYVDEDKVRAVSSFIHKADDIIIQVLPCGDMSQKGASQEGDSQEGNPREGSLSGGAPFQGKTSPAMPGAGSPSRDNPLQGRYISLDGHTRLYYAVMQGWKHVRAVAETSDDWVYRFVEEAKRRGVYTPADLALLSHREYEEKWNRFCDRFFGETDGGQEEGQTCDC